jgi:hypothetical protein
VVIGVGKPTNSLTSLGREGKTEPLPFLLPLMKSREITRHKIEAKFEMCRHIQKPSSKKEEKSYHQSFGILKS